MPGYNYVDAIKVKKGVLYLAVNSGVYDAYYTISVDFKKKKS